MTARKGPSPWPSFVVVSQTARLGRPADDGSLLPWWVAPLGAALDVHRRGGWAVDVGHWRQNAQQAWRAGGARPCLRRPSDIAPPLAAPAWWRASFPDAALVTVSGWRGAGREDYAYLHEDGLESVTGEAWTNYGGTRAPGYEVRDHARPLGGEGYTLLAGAIVVDALAVRRGLRQKCDRAMDLPRREWNALLDLLVALDPGLPPASPVSGSWLVRALDEILAAADERRRGWTPPATYFPGL